MTSSGNIWRLHVKTLACSNW